MTQIYLFFLSCTFAGFSAVVGSIIGNAAGNPGLWVGGVVGGLLGAVFAAAVARRLSWIQSRQFRGTAIGAALGFVAAALIAVNTLSSPVGPVLSTALVGIGALSGSHFSR